MDIQQQLETHANACQDIYSRADAEDRDLTHHERAQVQEHLAAIHRIKAAGDVQRKVDEFGRGIGAPDISQPGGAATFGGPGDQIVRSQG